MLRSNATAPLYVFVFVMLAVPSARAGDQRLFEITQIKNKGVELTIKWDVRFEAGIARGTYTAEKGALISKESIAFQLAKSINAEVAEAALAKGEFVELSASVIGISTRTGTTAGFIEKQVEETIGPSHGCEATLTMAEDPELGTSELIAPGSFSVRGPGLDASFTAPTGTTGSALAQMFADAMSAPGYEVFPNGNSLRMLAPPGKISFRTDGDGFEYILVAKAPVQAGAFGLAATLVTASLLILAAFFVLNRGKG